MTLLEILKQQRALMREHLDRIEEMIEEEEKRIPARKKQNHHAGDVSAELGVGS